MPVWFHTEDTQAPIIKKKIIERWLSHIITVEKANPGEINIIFCSDNFLRKINRKYLKSNHYTDIITFDYSAQKSVSGDLFISLERIKENAQLYKVKFLNELHRVMIHGILHLLGYKDDSAKHKKTMKEKENEYLRIVI